MNRLPLFLLTALGAVACSHLATGPAVDNASLPESVRVPAGHRQTLHTVGRGEITYECRAKADASSVHEWAFVAPVATLSDASGQTVGRYYAGPIWEANDGSKVTGQQVAVAPAAAGNIPMQLLRAAPASGTGAMQHVAYIQRLATRGGVAPTEPCDASLVGQRRQVGYQADYVFYTAS